VTCFSDRQQRLSLLGRHHSLAFERRVVLLDPGAVHPVVPAEWRDALVELVQGEISLELSDGRRHPVADGDVLWLYGLPVRAVHNIGADVAVVVAVRRRIPSAR
jgi:quercetin dioxygenase-like cupin family protein